MNEFTDGQGDEKGILKLFELELKVICLLYRCNVSKDLKIRKECEEKCSSHTLSERFIINMDYEIGLFMHCRNDLVI